MKTRLYIWLAFTLAFGFLAGCADLSKSTPLCAEVFTGKIVYPHTSCNGIVIQVTGNRFPDGQLEDGWISTEESINESPQSLDRVFGVYDMCAFSSAEIAQIEALIESGEEFEFTLLALDIGNTRSGNCAVCDMLVNLPSKIHRIALHTGECKDLIIYE